MVVNRLLASLVVKGEACVHSRRAGKLRSSNLSANTTTIQYNAVQHDMVRCTIMVCNDRVSIGLFVCILHMYV